jgi:hypothetical protein
MNSKRRAMNADMTEEEKAYQKENNRIIRKRFYDKQTKTNKEKYAIRNRERYKNNRDEINAKCREMYLIHPEIRARRKELNLINIDHQRERNRLYNQKNREKANTRDRERRKNDPHYVLKKRLRERVRSCMRSRGFKKTGKTQALLGCSWDKAVIHLENNERGLKMTDKGIHVDHIRPLASFKDLSSAWEQKTANHYLNLQLLPAKENISKNASFNYESWVISESGKALLALNREWRMETFFS